MPERDREGNDRRRTQRGPRCKPGRTADVVQSASALLRHGPDHAGVVLDGLRAWMRRKGYSTLDEVCGLLAVPEDQVARERADYVGAVREANNDKYRTR